MSDPSLLLSNALELVATDLQRIKADVEKKGRMLGLDEAQVVTGYIRVLVAVDRRQGDPADDDMDRLLEKASEIPEVREYFAKMGIQETPRTPRKRRAA